MIDSITLITPPDDNFQDATRILCVDLTEEQSKFVSDVLQDLDIDNRLVVYMWSSVQEVTWFLDKKNKSRVILFNANSNNQLIVGYLSAQTNGYYFGTLRQIEVASKKNIVSKEQLNNILCSLN